MGHLNIVSGKIGMPEMISKLFMPPMLIGLTMIVFSSTLYAGNWNQEKNQISGSEFVLQSCRDNPATCTNEETLQLMYEAIVETCSSVYGFKVGSVAFTNCMEIYVPNYKSIKPSTTASPTSTSKLDKAKSTCTELGFTLGTEKHGECVLKMMDK